MKALDNIRGQVSPMGIVTLAVSIFIGVYIIGIIYGQASNGSIAVGTQTMATVNTTLTTALSGMQLLTVGIIVASAVFILLLMGGGGQ